MAPAFFVVGRVAPPFPAVVRTAVEPVGAAFFAVGLVAAFFATAPPAAATVRAAPFLPTLFAAALFTGAVAADTGDNSTAA